MILSAQQISEAYRSGGILIVPFDEAQVQAATYDLRVGSQGATTSTKKIVNIKDVGYLLIQPGDFGVVTVLEEIRFGPQHACASAFGPNTLAKGSSRLPDRRSIPDITAV
ncbi:MAG: hypothetical protein M3436_04335 [Pseudomonadota bacterium]|nr:hypothetical protein [Pseudomonadota bacterium]